MSKELVKLPREVAEAISYFKENVPGEWWEQYILKVAMETERYIGNPEKCEAIKEFVNNMDNLRLFLKALVNGYEIEETPEDKVREYFKYPPIFNNGIGELSTAYRNGIRDTLNSLNIKIEGANA